MLDNDIRFKNAAVHALVEQLSGEILQLKLEIQEIQIAANEETKSSSGDKYETGRAMAQIEAEKLISRLNMKQDDLSKLLRLNSDLKKVVQPGAIVHCSTGIFFIGVHGSTVTVENQKVTSITLASPLAQALQGATVGAAVKLNGRETVVKAIY